MSETLFGEAPLPYMGDDIVWLRGNTWINRLTGISLIASKTKQ